MHPIPIDLWTDHWLMRRAGGVNAYLLPTDSGFVLVDTGFPTRRAELHQRLLAEGCTPGRLAAIVVTHADLDHTGHARWLRDLYRAPIALHPAEVGAAERANMAASRHRQPWLVRALMAGISWLVRSRRFSPDILLADGDDLARFGLDARVLHLPGHSRGSIGVLTRSGDLLCGDLLWNPERPEPQPNPDDPEAARASIARIRQSGVQRVFPGHGRPFAIEELRD